MGEEYLNYWGKTHVEDDGSHNWHPLVYHSLDVAAVGWVWLTREPKLLAQIKDALGYADANTFRDLIVFFLALHDLGKFADSFQGLNSAVRHELGKSGDAPVYNVRHDSLGFLLWENLFLTKRGFGSNYTGLIIEQEWFNTETVEEKIAWAETLNLLIQATTGHHGRPPVLQGTISVDSHFTEGDTHAAIEFTKIIFDLFQPTLLAAANWETVSEILRPLTFWLAGFSVVCDWIGSNAEIFPYRSKGYLSLKDYFAQVAVPQAGVALKKSGMLSSLTMPYGGARRLFDYLKSPTPLQALCSETQLAGESGPSLFILEDVTGAGKTEAAMILAQRQMETLHLKGFYIGLPTMATANGMYNRMRKYYRNLYAEQANPSLVLAHGARDMHDSFRESILESAKRDANYHNDDDSATALCAAWIADNAKKSLLGDAGIGTVDQSLLAVLRCKFHTLRLFGLMSKVLILDEVHAYDAYMNELICELLAAEARVGQPVVLLSATLPFSLRERFCQSYADGLGIKAALQEREKYPLLTQVSRGGISETQVETRAEVRRTVDVEFVHDEKNIESLIKEAVDKGQCVCWLRNTVADAVVAYTSLKGQLGDNLLLFHARFAMGDRLDIENRVLNLFGTKSSASDRAGKVLIATQVVEQSLDLDFDVMITDLAPIDLIIQRAGRLHRHRRDAVGNPVAEQGVDDGREAPRLWVHAPEYSETPDNDWYKKKFSKAGRVYSDHAKLWLTAKWLTEHERWQMPNDARAMIEFVYGDEQPIPASLQDWTDAAEQKDNRKESLAAQNTINFSRGYTAQNEGDWDDLNAPSRYSEEKTVKVVLATLADGVCQPIREQKTEDGRRTARSWAASEINLPAYIAAVEDKTDPVTTTAIKRAKEQFSLKGKYTVFVILSKNDIGYSGFAVNSKGQRIKILYNHDTGLERESV